MKTIYQDYTRYNLWANERLIEVFSNQSDDLLERYIETSFPSVKLTLLHIWDAELLWLQRLQGVSPSQLPSKDFQGTMSDVFTKVRETSLDFIHFIDNQPDDFFARVLHFKTISYGEASQQAAWMVHHCMNHSTFHRGQLITLGRQLGIEKFPATDLIYYLREG
ncbi:MAG: DinB family protein, partial [Bacteroidota bacterium]